MIIDIDIGNTRTKWRVAGEADIFYFSGEEFPEQWRVMPHGSRFRVSSVLAESQTRKFCDQLASLSVASVEIACVRNSIAGISVIYRNLASFGVDRWLALLAARNRHPSKDCIVLHGGTAVVADFLRADGQHLGGYIVGGWQTSLRALGEAVPALRPSTGDQLNPVHGFPGTTTLECIASGTSLLFRGFLRELAYVASLHFCSPVWLFAGGDADKMLQLYRELPEPDVTKSLGGGNSDCVPGLVLDGLAIALP